MQKSISTLAYKTINFIIYLFVLIGCSKSKPETVVLNEWGISIEVLPGWVHEINDTIMSISTAKVNFVKGVMNMDYINDDKLNSIDEYFYAVTTGMGSFFEGYKKISEGRSEVNGLRTIWHRMRSTYEDNLTEVLVYFIELDTHKFVTIICVARVDTFPSYEPEFTKMVYSIQKL